MNTSQDPVARSRRLWTAVGYIATLAEEDVRDYEQGLCFFCDGGHQLVKGTRHTPRHWLPLHEPDCPYVTLRDLWCGCPEEGHYANCSLWLAQP